MWSSLLPLGFFLRFPFGDFETICGCCVYILLGPFPEIQKISMMKKNLEWVDQQGLYLCKEMVQFDSYFSSGLLQPPTS